MEYTPHEQLLLERIHDLDEHDLASGIVPIRDVVDILGSRWKVEILTGNQGNQGDRNFHTVWADGFRWETPDMKR